MMCEAKQRRARWLARIEGLGGSFALVRAKGLDSRIAQVLRAEHGGLLGD